MAEHQTRLQTPLGRVRGHGSAKNGTHHWWMQRVTSLVMLPLFIWFTFSLASRAGSSWEVMAEWIGRPFNAILLILLASIGFYHTANGLQVVVEDYIRPDRSAMMSILAIKAVCTLLGLLAALSILRLAI
jgi:succinate dehydrogenase / fumarate reductase membrane anchor subunit